MKEHCHTKSTARYSVSIDQANLGTWVVYCPLSAENNSIILGDTTLISIRCALFQLITKLETYIFLPNF